MTRRVLWTALAFVLAAGATACRRGGAPGPHRASGYVDATDVRLAAKVPGRVTAVAVTEGMRVKAGDPVATLSPEDIDLALQRTHAERAQADAQVRLLRAGARPEDIQQAQAQVEAATADRQAADAELSAARADEARFTQLVENRAGATKQRDDAVTRRQLAEAHVKAASDRLAAANAALARLRAGARAEELDAARARVAAVDAQIATLEHDRGETDVRAPSAGIVTSRLVEPGELVSVGAPLAILIDLDRAWVNAYVEAPLVPSLRLEQSVTVVTDAGDRMPGTIAFISPKAEFTPRNVQTAAERARLVYRVKVTVDNRQGVLKPGMPVEVEMP
jgi:HlyD family secretion protein